MAGGVLTIFYAVLTYGALLVFLAGAFGKFFTSPDEKGQKISSKYPGILLSVLLLLSALKHLRFILNPVPRWLPEIQDAGLYGERMLPVFALAFLAFGLRRERAIRKNLSGGFAMVLLFLTAVSGWAVRYMRGSSIPATKSFLIGTLAFHPIPADWRPLFLIHYTLFLALAAFLPFAGFKRTTLAASLVVLTGFLIAAKSDPGPPQEQITNTSGAPYHNSLDYWLRNHGRILTENRDFSMSECRLCHKASSCNNCHIYSGVRTVNQGLDEEKAF